MSYYYTPKKTRAPRADGTIVDEAFIIRERAVELLYSYMRRRIVGEFKRATGSEVALKGITLPYSIVELKDHVESILLVGMGWHNVSKWRLMLNVSPSRYAKNGGTDLDMLLSLSNVKCTQWKAGCVPTIAEHSGKQVVVSQ